MNKNFIRTTIYLDPDVKLAAQKQRINISQVCNNFLTHFLLENDLQEITRKINDLEKKIKTLYDRREHLIAQGEMVDKETTLKKQYKEEILEFYRKGDRHKLSDDLNILWLKSPNNHTRLAIIGISEKEMLEWLKKNYDKPSPKPKVKKEKKK